MYVGENIFVITNLIGTISTFILVIYFLFKSNILKNYNKTGDGKVLIGLIFGLLAIYGTVSASEYMEARISVRDVAPIVAGFIAGPVSGVIAGLIGAIYRTTIGGTTMIACSLSTVLVGLIAGFIKKLLNKKELSVMLYVVFGFLLEAIHMGIILLLTTPFDTALEIVKVISLPMIVFNGLGAAVLLKLIDYLNKNKDEKKVIKKEKKVIKSSKKETDRK